MGTIVGLLRSIVFILAFFSIVSGNAFAEDGSATAVQGAYNAPNRAMLNPQAQPPQLSASDLQKLRDNLKRTHLPGPPLPVQSGAAAPKPMVPATPAPIAPSKSSADAEVSPQTTELGGTAPQVAAPVAASAFEYYLTKLQDPFYSFGTDPIAEPSVGASGSVVFMTGNWFAAYSTNYGQTFTYVNPNTQFPNLDGGFCCDQTVIYDPTRDLMIWQLLYLYSSSTQKGSYRTAFAHSASVASGGWCYYDWNPQSFGMPAGYWLDYPNVGLSNGFVYYTANVFDAGDHFYRAVIWRIPLDAASACITLTANYLVISDHSTLTLAQGATSTMYWTSFNSNSSVRIYNWPDSSSTISWNDVGVSAFTAGGKGSFQCAGPDGVNWCSRADFRHGATAWVANGVIGFMWNSAQGGSFPYPYIAVARFSESTRALIDQPTVWNPSFAFIYPGVGVNDRGHIAGTWFYGGGSLYPGMAQFIWDDLSPTTPPWESYVTATSETSPSEWGDFYNARRHGTSPHTWVATGEKQLSSGNTQAVYVWFGRGRDQPWTAASLTSPTPGSMLAGSSVTFNWSTGSGITQYWLYVGTSGAGSFNVFNQSMGTSRSATVSGLPVTGGTVYVRLWSLSFTGSWTFNDYTYNAFSGVKAVLTTPTPGSTISTPSVTFGWSAGTNVSEYWLYVGTSGVGTADIFSQSTGTNLSRTVSGIPLGRTLYVRLWSLLGGSWQFNDYTYSTAPNIATMTSPVPGSTLASTTVNFQWTSGTGVSQYWLYVGTGGLGSANLYDHSTGSSTSTSVSGLPTTGVTVYVRLWSLIGSTWYSVDYTYTAAKGPAVMTSPAPNSTLAGTTVTFNWTTGVGATQYWLYVGTTGPGSTNLYNQSTGTNTSQSVSGLPSNGSTVYVRLWTLVSGNWLFNDYLYQATGTPACAVVSSPTPGSTLTSSSATFSWTAASGATQYWLYVGTSVGGADLYNQSTGTNRSVTVNNLPINGNPVYVRLWSLIGGSWCFSDQTYGTPKAAAMILPTPGSTR